MEKQDAIGLFYDKERNLFVDEDGFVIWSIFENITPGTLFLFRLYKDYMCIPHRTMVGVMCELYYPEDN